MKHFLISLSLISLACTPKDSTSTAPPIEVQTKSKTTKTTTATKTVVASKKIGITEFWDGRIYFSDFQPDGKQTILADTWLISTQEDLDQFISQIPSKQIQKKQPAPDSKDPLHNGKTIDFSKHRLLVSFRYDNMYALAPITEVREENGMLIADRILPDLEDTMMMASMNGVGTYYAVLIPAGEMKVEVITQP